MKAFIKETDLCAAFIKSIPEEWVAYPETGGFDILLVRKEDGFQIGIEAKLKLNAKVILQAVERKEHYYITYPGPDCRAVLVPEDFCNGELAGISRLLNITVIKMREPKETRDFKIYPFHPQLPKNKDSYIDEWFEICPQKRMKLPEWIPDVAAGAPSPLTLTPWKVKAIKIAVTVEKRGYVTRKDFEHFKIHMSLWTQRDWLSKDGQGGWKQGENFPNFRTQHPVNYEEIAADYDIWKNPLPPVTQTILPMVSA